MSYIELGLIGVAVLCILIGFLFGLAKGLIKSAARLVIVIGAIACAIIFNKQITAAIFDIQVNGAPLDEFVVSTVKDSMQQPEGFDINQIVDLIFPMFIMIIQIITCIISIIVFLFISHIIDIIIAIILKHPLKDKSKHRLLGGAVGGLSGLVVAFTISSLVTGLVPNFAEIYKIKIGDTAVSEQLPLKEEQLNEFGFLTFEDGVVYKIGSFVNPLVYNNIASCTYTNSKGEEKSYTLNGQIKALVSTANLAGSLMSLSDIDFSNPESTADAIKAIGEIDFSNMSEEEKAVVDDLIETVVSAAGFEEGSIDLSVLNAETLAQVDFGAVADTIQIVTDIQNSDTPPTTEQVAEVLGNLLEKKDDDSKSLVDIASSMNVDMSSFTEDEDTSEMIQDAIDSLSTSGDYSAEEIAALQSLLFGTTAA